MRLNFAQVESPSVAKVFENKFGQVVEKPFDLILCLFGFVKTTKLEDSSEYSQCVQNVLAKVASLVKFIYKPKKLLSAERLRYEFSATVLHRICKQRFS